MSCRGTPDMDDTVSGDPNSNNGGDLDSASDPPGGAPAAQTTAARTPGEPPAVPPATQTSAAPLAAPTDAAAAAEPSPALHAHDGHTVGEAYVDIFPAGEVTENIYHGHMIMYIKFMNRLETLYRRLTTGNIDIELEEGGEQQQQQQQQEQQQTQPPQHQVQRQQYYDHRGLYISRT